jgi:DNA repair protein RadC
MPNDRLDYVEIMEAFAAYVAEDRPRVERPEDAARLLRPVLRDKRQEEMHVLLLDTRNRVTATQLVTVGLVDRSQAHAREIFRRAIAENCTKVILVHNHPSGDPTPSAADLDCTKGLVAAGKVVGIEVTDHLVLGQSTASRPKDFVSFREEKLL